MCGRRMKLEVGILKTTGATHWVRWIRVFTHVISYTNISIIPIHVNSEAKTLNWLVSYLLSANSKHSGCWRQCSCKKNLTVMKTVEKNFHLEIQKVFFLLKYWGTQYLISILLYVRWWWFKNNCSFKNTVYLVLKMQTYIWGYFYLDWQDLCLTVFALYSSNRSSTHIS